MICHCCVQPEVGQLGLLHRKDLLWFELVKELGLEAFRYLPGHREHLQQAGAWRPSWRLLHMPTVL